MDFATLMNQLQQALAEEPDIDLEMAPARSEDTYCLGFGDIELELFLHPDERRVVIEAAVAGLGNPEPVELAERLLVLMKLNTISRFGSELQLGVDDDNTVLASLTVEVGGLEIDAFAGMLLHVIDRVTSLRSAWDSLGDLLAESSAEAPGFQPKADDPAGLHSSSTLRA